MPGRGRVPQPVFVGDLPCASTSCGVLPSDNCPIRGHGATVASARPSRRGSRTRGCRDDVRSYLDVGDIGGDGHEEVVLWRVGGICLAPRPSTRTSVRGTPPASRRCPTCSPGLGLRPETSVIGRSTALGTWKGCSNKPSLQPRHQCLVQSVKEWLGCSQRLCLRPGHRWLGGPQRQDHEQDVLDNTQDLGAWAIQSVTSMEEMFCGSAARPLTRTSAGAWTTA